MSENDEIYGQGILHNFHNEHMEKLEWSDDTPTLVSTGFEPPLEPKLTYFEEHVLRLLDSIYSILDKIESRI